MTGVEGQTTCTKTGNEWWDSTTSTGNYSNYTVTSTGFGNDAFWHDSKEYKRLIKKEIVRELKASWVLKNTRIKSKRFKKVNRKSKIRNQLPKKIRKD